VLSGGLEPPMPFTQQARVVAAPSPEWDGQIPMTVEREPRNYANAALRT
jgi:hypothetical protein